MKWQRIGNIAGRAGADGKSPPPIDQDAIIASIAARIPVPKDGTNGKDGKDAPPIETDALIDAIVAKIPRPKDGINGKDAEPINVELIVKELLVAMPPPIPGKDGKNADSELIVEEVLKRIPSPKDGKDAPPIDTHSVVTQVLKLLPDPVSGKDGKDADPIDLDLIVERVLKRVQVPKDGKDAPPIDLELIVEKVLKRIPQPKDGINGKDAPPIDTEVLSASIFQKVLGQIPAPIPGEDGKSVDLEAIRNLVASEVTRAVESIPKPINGRDGLVGPQGPIGKQGQEGMPGRDALDLEIMHGIDEAASYQRNTFAKHRNGLFYSYRTTDPVVDKNYEAAGWMCINAGIWDEVSSLAADQRTVVRSLELSDGKLITSKFTVPTMIHKGTWKDSEYHQGDTVTLGGSTWHANETTRDRPGTSKAWTLAVKRGSDGKDLRPNDDEPNGKQRPVYLSSHKS